MKRTLAILMCLVMCLSLLPLAALATDGGAEEIVETEEAEAIVETEEAVAEPVLLESEGGQGQGVPDGDDHGEGCCESSDQDQEQVNAEGYSLKFDGRGPVSIEPDGENYKVTLSFFYKAPAAAYLCAKASIPGPDGSPSLSVWEENALPVTEGDSANEHNITLTLPKSDFDNCDVQLVLSLHAVKQDDSKLVSNSIFQHLGQGGGPGGPGGVPESGHVDGYSITHDEPVVGRVSVVSRAHFNAPAHAAFAYGGQIINAPVGGWQEQNGGDIYEQAYVDAPIEHVDFRLVPGTTYEAYLHLRVTDQEHGDVVILDEEHPTFTYTTQGSLEEMPLAAITPTEETDAQGDYICENGTIQFSYGDEFADYNSYTYATRVTVSESGTYHFALNYSSRTSEFSAALEDGTQEGGIYMDDAFNSQGFYAELSADKSYRLYIHGAVADVKNAVYTVTKIIPGEAEFSVTKGTPEVHADNSIVTVRFQYSVSKYYKAGYEEDVEYQLASEVNSDPTPGSLTHNGFSGHSPFTDPCKDKAANDGLSELVAGQKYVYRCLIWNSDKTKVLAYSELGSFTAPAAAAFDELENGANNLYNFVMGKSYRYVCPEDGLYSLSGLWARSMGNRTTRITLYGEDGTVLGSSSTKTGRSVDFHYKMTKGTVYYIYPGIETISPMFYIVPISAADMTNEGLAATTDAALDGLQNTIRDLMKDGSGNNVALPDYVSADSAEEAALRSAIENGDAITATVTGEEVTPQFDEQSALDEAAGEAAEGLLFLDLGVELKNKGKDLGSLTELEDEILFEVELPEGYSVGNKFAVVRLHNGNTEKLETTAELNRSGKPVVKFGADKFSLYGIYAEEGTTPKPTPKPTPTPVPKPEAMKSDAKPPKTGDEAMPLVWALLALTLGTSAVIVGKKRRG